MFENYLGSGYASFDGKVLETWQPNNEGSGRLHVAVIKAVNIMKQGRGLYFMEIETTYSTGPIALSFKEEHLATAEQLQKLVSDAKEKL